jgi:hypothetical protein
MVIAHPNQMAPRHRRYPAYRKMKGKEREINKHIKVGSTFSRTCFRLAFKSDQN